VGTFRFSDLECDQHGIRPTFLKSEAHHPPKARVRGRILCTLRAGLRLCRTAPQACRANLEATRKPLAGAVWVWATKEGLALPANCGAADASNKRLW
jgi:hypothetical protein